MILQRKIYAPKNVESHLMGAGYKPTFVGANLFNMEQEIWKDIIGYEGLYTINTNGKIKNRHGLILKEKIKTNGYIAIVLCKTHKIKNFYIHRLIAINFIPNPKNKKCINHKDGIKSNNNIKNLEWVTHKENTKHARINNLLNQPTEFQLPQTKLSNKQVIEIRKRLSDGERGYVIHKEYGVSQQTICDIKKFRTRKTI